MNAYNATKIVFIRRYASIIFNNAAEQLHNIAAFYKTFKFSGTSVIANIITKFTGLAGLIHVPAGYKPVVLIGIWTEAGHFCRKNVSLHSITKDFEFHF